MKSRPYITFSLEKLKELYNSSSASSDTVDAIVHELSYRNRPGAIAFRNEISKGIPTANAGSKSRPNGVSSRSGHKLTDEQLKAVDQFSTRESAKVVAFAGAGKTATLLAMSKSDTRNGLYVAFNRSIADEAKAKFGSNVKCHTWHSVAFHNVKNAFPSSGKLFEHVNGNGAVQLLSIPNFESPKMTIASRSLGTLVCNTISKFCQSRDTQFRLEHIPRRSRYSLLTPEEARELSYLILSYAKCLWLKMIDPQDSTPLGHDGYLKVWALSQPVIQKDYILLDEAQDTNDVVLDILERQSAQIVLVGDPHQQIYAWRGAINAMERFPTKLTSHLTMSFRFGSVIADAATKVLRVLGEDRPLRGNPAVVSRLGCKDFDASLSRTNAAVIEQLLKLLSDGRRTHIVGGTDDALRLLQGVKTLQGGRPCDVPLLFGYSKWADVVEAAQTEEDPELQRLVNLVQRFEIDRLIEMLKRTTTKEEEADVVLSTVHKAKGREWSKVLLTDDFMIPVRNPDGTLKPPSREELRIMYVAITRAKHAVDISPSIRTAFNITQQSESLSHSVGQSFVHETERVSQQNVAPTEQQPPAESWLTKVRGMFQ